MEFREILCSTGFVCGCEGSRGESSRVMFWASCGVKVCVKFLNNPRKCFLIYSRAKTSVVENVAINGEV